MCITALTVSDYAFSVCVFCMALAVNSDYFLKQR
jgi:hypothetical protein